jgi:hypothetical protein
MGYAKYELAVGRYKVGKYGRVKLPDNCYWRVGSTPDERVSMQLFERIKDEKGIMGCSPIMCLLSLDEAIELSRKLRKAAKDAKNMTPEQKKWFRRAFKEIKKDK